MSNLYCREHMQQDTPEEPCTECSKEIAADDKRIEDATRAGAAAERARICQWLRGMGHTMLPEQIEQGAHDEEQTK